MGLYKKASAANFKINRSEAEVLKACLEYLKLRGHFVWRQNTGQATTSGRRIRFGIPGCADIIGITRYSGKFLAVECKSLTGRQSIEQIAFERECKSSGGIYILARSIEDLKAAGL